MAGTARLGLQGLADAVRHRPTGEVAPLLGYRPDPTERSRWRRPRVTIGTRHLNATLVCVMAIMGVH